MLLSKILQEKKSIEKHMIKFEKNISFFNLFLFFSFEKFLKFLKRLLGIFQQELLNKLKQGFIIEFLQQFLKKLMEEYLEKILETTKNLLPDEFLKLILGEFLKKNFKRYFWSIQWITFRFSNNCFRNLSMNFPKNSSKKGISNFSGIFAFLKIHPWLLSKIYPKEKFN